MMNRIVIGLIGLSAMAVSLVACGGSNGENMSELDRLRLEQQQKKQQSPAENVSRRGLLTPADVDVSAYMPKSKKEVNRSMHRMDNVECAGWYAFAGDTMEIDLTSKGKVKCDIYNVESKRKIKTLTGDGNMTFSCEASAKGIYALQISPVDDEASVQYTVTLPVVKDGTPRPVVNAAVETCRRNDFMAYPVESVKSRDIFPEPKKVGLRSQLKSAFSGSSRVVVAMNIPAGAKSVVYTLRVSNNERTVGTDGELASRLMSNKKKVKILGIPVYEREKNYSIGNLFVDARPATEADAFCNMYVLKGKRDVRTFQDTTSGSSAFNYDVDQSQLGTQSTIGEFPVGKNSTIYLGFENERLRYDTYVWLEAVAFTRDVTYNRPVFSLK